MSSIRCKKFEPADDFVIVVEMSGKAPNNSQTHVMKDVMLSFAVSSMKVIIALDVHILAQSTDRKTPIRTRTKPSTVRPESVHCLQRSTRNVSLVGWHIDGINDASELHAAINNACKRAYDSFSRWCARVTSSKSRRNGGWWGDSCNTNSNECATTAFLCNPRVRAPSELGTCSLSVLQWYSLQ